jgi:hypothetical protein
MTGLAVALFMSSFWIPDCYDSVYPINFIFLTCMSIVQSVSYFFMYCKDYMIEKDCHGNSIIPE